jgi:type IV pilus assembly protein PilM
MADSNSILALNLGSQRASLARFTVGKKGSLTLKDLAFEEISGDVTNDAMRKSGITAAVAGLAKQLKAKDEEVIYAVPSQNVITRAVKLPAVGDVSSIVGFEAQQAVPFPLSETVWHYQTVSQDGPEAEVLIAAVRAELLDDLNNAVEAAGMKPVLAEGGPFALYNSYIHNYGFPEQCTLLLDMGARTTDTIFIDGQKVFITSFPNAGAHVTQAIAREMGAEYDDAEASKRESGFVNLGGNYADHEDPQVDAMSKVIRNQFTRLHAEVQRRIQMYRQQGGAAPVQIVLAGGASAMSYTKEFFEEKFRLPVEWFNALNNVTVGGKVDAELAGANGHTVGELVGLALRRSDAKQPLSLDLSPTSVKAAKDLQSKKPKLFAAAALIVGSLAAFWFFNKSGVAKVEKALAAVQKEISGLKGADDAIEAQQARLRKEGARLDHIKNAYAGRKFLPELLNQMNAALPNNKVWLTSMQFMDTNKQQSLPPIFNEQKPFNVLGFTESKFNKKADSPVLELDTIYMSGLFEGEQKAVQEAFEALIAAKGADGNPLFDVPEKWLENTNEWFAVNYNNTLLTSSFEMVLKLKEPFKAPAYPNSDK